MGKNLHLGGMAEVLVAFHYLDGVRLDYLL